MVVRRHGDTHANLGKGPLCHLYSNKLIIDPNAYKDATNKGNKETPEDAWAKKLSEYKAEYMKLQVSRTASK